MPDTNVLLYAVNEDSEPNDRARRWLESALSGTDTVSFAWQALMGFVRISTHPSILPRPLPPEDAFEQVRRWLGAENAGRIEPGPHHIDIVERLLARGGGGGDLVSDAHLAAIAIERGAKLTSFDSDFHRFADLDFEYLGAH